MQVSVTLLDPEYVTGLAHAKEGDAGFDLAAAYDDYTIPVRGNVSIPCGVKVAMGNGIFGQVVMRSGKGFHQDLSCHIGTIDSGYRGELFVKVRNHGEHPVTIKRGERFAQIIFQPYIHADIVLVSQERFADLTTARGETGHGSSGS